MKNVATFARRWIFAGNVAILGGVVFLGCAQRSSNPSKPQVESPVVREPTLSERYAESHQWMLRTLREVHLEAEEHHPFLGTRPLKNAEHNLKEHVATAGDLDLSMLHGVYGQELLRNGRTAEAIRNMEMAVGLLRKHQKEVPLDVLAQTNYLLAVANLRDGENANCVHCINGERCLFPITGQGIHEQPEGSRRAIKYFQRALEINPQDVRARWLLNIAFMTLGEYPDKVPAEYLIAPESFQSEASPVGEFRNVAKPLGLGVLGCAGGVAVDDFDGDLDFDIFFSTWATDGQLKYFRNNGDGTFVDATDEANLAGLFGGLNLIHADYDNDGDLDLLVLRGAWLESFGRHPVSLLQNDGTGKFIDVSRAVGLCEDNYPTQTACWGDYDRDGDLDLFIGHEGFPSQLFENDGNGMFVDVSRKAGVGETGMTKGVLFGDYDGDDFPDIYVSNFPGQNRLFHNNGDKTFTDVARDAGVSGPFNSFPAWFWDMDNDGIQDLYVASYEKGIEHVARDYLGLPGTTEPDCFYQGTKDGKFKNVTAELGFTRVTQPMGVNFGDIDNDGFLDFYLGTGYVDYEGLIPNLLFRNDRGKRLQDITFSARVGHLQKGHGVAFADIDQDGDQDILAVMGGWFRGDAFARAVFENPGKAGDNVGNWLAVRLVGVKSNRCAIGARLQATFDEAGATRSVYRWVNTGGTFGSNPLRVHLGVGQASQITELSIHWPSTGETQVIRDLPVNHYVEIREGEPEPKLQQLNSFRLKAEG